MCALEAREMRGIATIAGEGKSIRVKVGVHNIPQLDGSYAGSVIVLTNMDIPEYSAELLRAIQLASLNGIAAIDHTGTVTEWNGCCERMFRVKQDVAVGQKLHDRLHLGDRSLDSFLSAANKNESLTFRCSGLRPDGTDFPCEVCVSSLSPAHNAGELSFVLLFTDRTAQAIAEKEIHHHHSVLTAIIGGCGDGVAAMDDSRAFVHMNDRFAAMFADPPKTKQECMAMAWTAVIPAEMVTQVLALSPARSTLTFLQRVARGVYSVTLGCILAKDGTAAGSFIIARDVTENKKFEEQLEAAVRDRTNQVRTTEVLLQTVLDFSPCIIYMKDTAGVYLHINKAFEDAMKVRRDQVIHQRDVDVFPSLAPRMRHIDTAVVTGRKTITNEVSTGDVVFHNTKFPIMDTAGRVYAVGCISLDITAIKRVESQLSIQERRFRVLMEQAPIAIASYLPSGELNKANSAHRRIWGDDKGTLNDVCLMLLAEMDRASLTALLRRAMTGDHVKVPANTYVCAGGPSWLEIHAYPIHDEHGVVSELICITVDLTDLQKSEQDRIRLAAQEAAAQESSLARTRFLASVRCVSPPSPQAHAPRATAMS